MHDEDAFRQLEELLRGKVDDVEEELPSDTAALVLRLGESYGVDRPSFVALTAGARTS